MRVGIYLFSMLNEVLHAKPFPPKTQSQRVAAELSPCCSFEIHNHHDKEYKEESGVGKPW